MGWIRGIGWVLAVGSCWAAAQSEARACICSGNAELVAPGADVHPLDAALVFSSWCGGSVDGWTVAVDGGPALLVGTETFQGFGEFVVEPAPAQGAEVVLTQSCAGSLPPDGCFVDGDPIEQARFVIGPADLVAPPAANEVLIDHELGAFARDCGDPEEFDLSISATVTFSALEPDAWAVVRFLVDGEPVQVEQRSLFASAQLQSGIVGMASDYEGREVCVEVQTRDASGNASAVQSDCTAIPVSSSSGCTTGATSHSPFLILVVAAGLRRRRRR